MVVIEEVVVESLSRWWLREVVTSSRSVVTKVLGVGACGYQRPRGHQGEMKQGMRTTPERRQKDARKEIAEFGEYEGDRKGRRTETLVLVKLCRWFSVAIR